MHIFQTKKNQLCPRVKFAPFSLSKLRGNNFMISNLCELGEQFHMKIDMCGLIDLIGTLTQKSGPFQLWFEQFSIRAVHIINGQDEILQESNTNCPTEQKVDLLRNFP